MKPTQRLHELGQSLWLDNITRTLLDDGTLERYVREYSVTGLTSNPSIFDKAIGGGDAYDDDIEEKTREGLSGEELFLQLALDDLRRAARLFAPAHQRTSGVDGWVSMEVSPLLASDTRGSIEAARRIHEAGRCENLFVKIPGTPEGAPAIEESIHRGVPINVTLLFSSGQYEASAHAYMRGIERRIRDGLDPNVRSVASLFVSRWDVASNKQLPESLHNTLGIAVAKQTYRAYRQLLESPEWKKLADAGAQPQRLLWASTGTKDPNASDTLYVSTLAAPDTINTLPDNTLLAFAERGQLEGTMPADGGDADEVVAHVGQAGVDVEALAKKLQKDGAQAFVKSWNQLLQRIEDKAGSLDRSRTDARHDAHPPA